MMASKACSSSAVQQKPNGEMKLYFKLHIGAGVRQVQIISRLSRYRNILLAQNVHFYILAKKLQADLPHHIQLLVCIDHY